MNRRTSSNDYLQRILNARVYDVAVETPLERAPLLSARLGQNVWLKREDLQQVFSFKLRGAFNKMASLSTEERRRGVIAASAGNHAQGVALAAKTLGGPATIVMPVTTPRIKVEAVKHLGASVVLFGDSYDDAYAEARRLERVQHKTFIPPYDDPEVIAGQGTIGMEILRQHSGPLDAIFVAIGGGGLIAGIAAYVKQLRPSVRIIGVQPIDSDAMRRSLAAGRRVTLSRAGLFADGVAVKRVGAETFKLCRAYVDEILTVSTDEICAAIKDVFEETRSILEPAGALAIAGMKAYAKTARAQRQGQTWVAVACGANMNFDRLRFVAERAEVGEAREALLAVTIPERPGSFKRFCERLGHRNVTEFNYRYAGPKEAHVFVGVGIQETAEIPALITSLRRAGLSALDLTQDEMSKLHLRHMVGGRAPQVRDEVLFRFEFPERPGALMKFLNHLGGRWNISLFHYRNAGSDNARVLVGLQVPPRDRAALTRFLNGLGYAWVDESHHPAFSLFL